MRTACRAATLLQCSESCTLKTSANGPVGGELDRLRDGNTGSGDLGVLHLVHGASVAVVENTHAALNQRGSVGLGHVKRLALHSLAKERLRQVGAEAGRN